MKPTVSDLVKFNARERKSPGPPCRVCALPERAVIDEAKREAPSRQLGGVMIRRWLIAECGYTEDTAPERQAFGHHFGQGHHREAA